MLRFVFHISTNEDYIDFVKEVVRNIVLSSEWLIKLSFFTLQRLLKQLRNSLIIKIKCFITFSFFANILSIREMISVELIASRLTRYDVIIWIFFSQKLPLLRRNHHYRWPIDFPKRASNVDLLYCLCCLRGQAVKQFICQGYKASWHSCDSTVKDAMSNRYFCESWCLRQFLALFLCVISILVDTLDYNTNMSWTIFIVKYEKSRRNSDWM